MLSFVFVSRAFGAGDDEDLKSENEHKHEVSYLYSPFQIENLAEIDFGLRKTPDWITRKNVLQDRFEIG